MIVPIVTCIVLIGITEILMIGSVAIRNNEEDKSRVLSIISIEFGLASFFMACITFIGISLK